MVSTLLRSEGGVDHLLKLRSMTQMRVYAYHSDSVLGHSMSAHLDDISRVTSNGGGLVSRMDATMHDDMVVDFSPVAIEASSTSISYSAPLDLILKTARSQILLLRV